ncbi:MAG: 3-oxoacyl-ACP reductase family protein [Desulfobacterium sp.]
MYELTDKVAIITGGSRGIGKGIATIMAKQGAKIVIADLLKDEAEKTAAEINSNGGTAMAVETDICNFDQVKSMVSQSKEQFGSIDILVNNAGWDKMVPFYQTDPDLWGKIIDINYRGVLNCVFCAMEEMKSQNSGKIINIASDAGRVGSSGEAVYAGTKGAVIAFSKSMARELARNKINVNVICPGPTNTPLVMEMKNDSEFNNKVLSGMEKIIPLKRMGVPEDIAYAVTFLSSKESDFITGQVLSVSGGLTMAG